MNVNWTDIVTSLVTVLAFVGPPFLVHHRRISQIAAIVVQIGQALNGRGIAAPVIDTPVNETPDNPRAN